METEENKYYIPTIEEFHVGFECEFYNSKDKHFYFEAPDGWIKTMIGENLYLREFTNQYQLLKENLFRVKYLNKEDIESCLSNLLDFKIINFEDDNFIETLPFFESYHLTRLDIWILATYYKIPIIILYYPNKTLIETNNEFPILTTYYEEGLERLPERESLVENKEENPNVQSYYFIISSAIKSNTIPSYSIIFRIASRNTSRVI